MMKRLLSIIGLCLSLGLAQAELASEINLDKRFVQALKQLNVLYADQVPIVIEQRGDTYQLQQQGRIVYTLENHNFLTLYEATKYAALALMQKKPMPVTVIESKIDVASMNPNDFVKVITDNNNAANSDDTALKQLAQALLLLGFSSDDALQIMDDIGANSLMVLAWLEARSGKRDNSLLILLADNLGYRCFVNTLVRDLSVEPLAAYYRGKINAASRPFDAFLMIKQTVDQRKSSQWLSVFNETRQQPLALSLSLYGLNNVPLYDVRSKLLLLYPLVIYRDYINDTTVKSVLLGNQGLDLSIQNMAAVSTALSDDLTFSPAFLIENFEQILANKSRLPAGGVLTEDVIIHYWQSRLMNAYYDIATNLLEVDYDYRLANSLLTILQANSSSASATGLATWLAAVLSSYDDENNYQAFMTLDSDHPLSVTLLQSLYDKQTVSLSSDQYSQQMRHTLLAQLDARETFDSLRLRLLAAANDKQHTPLLDKSDDIGSEFVAMLSQRGQTSLLKKALSISDQPAIKADILSALLHHDDNPRWFAELKSLYQSHRGQLPIVAKYIDALLQQQQPETAMQELDQWIISHKNLSRQQYLLVMSLVARCKAQQGDLSAAWESVALTLDYHYPPALLVASEIALAMGDRDKSQQTISHYRQRLGNTAEALSLQLRQQWMLAQYSASLDLLTQWSAWLTDEQLTKIVRHSINASHPTSEAKIQLRNAVKQSALSDQQQQTLISLLSH